MLGVAFDPHSNRVALGRFEKIWILDSRTRAEVRTLAAPLTNWVASWRGGTKPAAGAVVTPPERLRRSVLPNRRPACRMIAGS